MKGMHMDQNKEEQIIVMNRINEYTHDQYKQVIHGRNPSFEAPFNKFTEIQLYGSIWLTFESYCMNKTMRNARILSEWWVTYG